MTPITATPSTIRRILQITSLLLQLSLSLSQQCTSDDGTCTAPSALTTPLPTTYQDPCRDTHEFCRRWSILGECNANAKFMYENCPRSCGSCKPLKLSGVDDIGGSEKDDDGRDICRDEVLECEGYASEGECLINPDYMRENCKYSCWVCVDPSKDRALGVDETTIAEKLLYQDMNLGRNQLIRDISNEDEAEEDPMTPIEHENIRNTIAQMETYAKHTITSPNVHVKARERCRNEFRMCAEWASRGYCYPAGHPKQLTSQQDGGAHSGSKDVLFMMNMCPLACKMCEEIPSLACAGKRHPYAQPVMDKNNGLNTYFEKLWKDVVDDRKSSFVSYPDSDKEENENDSYVAVLPDAVTKQEADALEFLSKAIGFSSDYIASCRGNRECTAYKIAQDDTYKQIMERIATLANTTLDYLEPMEFFRHKANADRSSVLKHNYDLSGVWKPAGPRVLSFLIFLSDQTSSKGGQLGFPYLDWLYIQPKRGTIVLFPNVVNENVWEMDPLTSYEYFGLDAEGDDVFVATVNVRLHNWTDANYRGCT